MDQKQKSLNKGVYCLVIANRKEMELPIGSLGRFIFPEGYYCYVGSAMNNLEARVKRHLSKSKKKKWHIDFLLDKADVIHTRTIETTKRLKCRLNRKVAGLADSTIKKFGSSDCKCDGHLHYFEMNPLFKKEFHDVFEKELGSLRKVNY